MFGDLHLWPFGLKSGTKVTSARCRIYRGGEQPAMVTWHWHLTCLLKHQNVCIRLQQGPMSDQRSLNSIYATDQLLGTFTPISNSDFESEARIRNARDNLVFFYASSYSSEEPTGTRDRQTNERQDPYCCLFGRPHNNSCFFFQFLDVCLQNRANSSSNIGLVTLSRRHLWIRTDARGYTYTVISLKLIKRITIQLHPTRNATRSLLISHHTVWSKQRRWALASDVVWQPYSGDADAT